MLEFRNFWKSNISSGIDICIHIWKITIFELELDRLYFGVTFFNFYVRLFFARIGE